MTKCVTEDTRQERHVSRLVSCISLACALPSLNLKKRETARSLKSSRIWKMFAFGIWSPELWSRNLALKKIRNSDLDNSNDMEFGIQNLESVIHSVESSPVLSIQDCLG